MGGCCSLIRRKSDEHFGGSKFKVIDGRRFHQLDDSNYLLPNDEEEEERLDIQHDMLKHVFDGNFSAPIHNLLKSGARVLDVWLVRDDKEFNGIHTNQILIIHHYFFSQLRFSLLDLRFSQRIP